MGDAADEPEESALWRFSLALYAFPGVAQALIALQDRDGLDVNLMLFALWIGVSGRGLLSNDKLRAANRAVRTIRAEIVEPLRTLRRRLKHDRDADVRHLREGVKALELAAEKLVQTRLARFAGPFGGETSLCSCLTAAYANLALYLGPQRADGPEAVVIREALERFVRDN